MLNKIKEKGLLTNFRDTCRFFRDNSPDFVPF